MVRGRFIWWVLSGSVAPAGTPSGNPVDVPGMFHNTQCELSRMPLPGRGSISWNTRTKLLVSTGACFQRISGDTMLGNAKQVYLSGILLPSAKPGSVITSGVAGAVATGD